MVPPLAPLTIEQIVRGGCLAFVEDALTALTKVAELSLLEAFEAEAEVVVECFEKELFVVEDIGALAAFALETIAADLKNRNRLLVKTQLLVQDWTRRMDLPKSWTSWRSWPDSCSF